MKRGTKRVLAHDIAMALCAWGSASGMALAQTTPAPAAQQAKPAGSGELVTVTANRRVKVQEKVGVSVTACRLTSATGCPA